jgi:energy-coupling factor transporter transmembrane protein EcfT
MPRENNNTTNTLKTVIKLFLLASLNVAAFLPIPQFSRFLLLVAVTAIAIATRLRWHDIGGLVTFMILNFGWMLVAFYFVTFDLLAAILMLVDFAITFMMMAVGAFVFWKMTPGRDLAVALRAIKVPRSLTLAIVVATTFLPIVSASFKEVRLYQQARGLKISIFKLAPLVIPAILRLLDFSVDLSLSMQSRGFDL